MTAAALPTAALPAAAGMVLDQFMTLSGRIVDRTNPRPEDNYHRDWANALAHLNRWGGSATRQVSVLEHQLRVWERHELEFPSAPEEHHLAAGMHDNTEEKLSDLVKPIKATIPGYKELELRHEAAMCEWYGLPFPFPPTIKPIDDRMAITEAVQIQPAKSRDHWLARGVPYRDMIVPDPRFVIRVPAPAEVRALLGTATIEITSFPPLVLQTYLTKLRASAARIAARGEKVAPGIAQILADA